MSTFKQFFVICLLLILALASGCKKDDTTSGPAPLNTGTANFSVYVAIGNSLTAGYQSSALSTRDQAYSSMKLISQQVQTAFEQPLMQNPGIGGRLRLTSLGPPPVIVHDTSVNFLTANLNAGLTRPYNNLGIPGAAIIDVLDTTDFTTKSNDRKNPFFSLVLRSKVFGSSVFAQAKALHPTFISFWLGANDVLGFAVSGGVLPSAPTPAGYFALKYNEVIDSLVATGASIVTANIPDVTVIPYFTTLGPQIRAALPGGVYLRYQMHGNSGVAYDSTRFDTSASTPLITLSGGDYISVLGTASGKWYRDLAASLGVSVGAVIGGGIDTTKPFGLHPQNPWPDALTLDAGEITIAQAAVTAFNNTISTAATSRGIAYVDVHKILQDIKTSGYPVPSLGTFTADYITGGLFSLDGVHPSDQGQGIIANEWIKVINTKFNASIPYVDVSSLPAIPFGKAATEKNGTFKAPPYQVWRNMLNLTSSIPMF